MNRRFSKLYPEYATIEQHIRRAQAERQVVIANAVANGIAGAIRGIGRLFAAKGSARVTAAAAHPARV